MRIQKPISDARKWYEQIDLDGDEVLPGLDAKQAAAIFPFSFSEAQSDKIAALPILDNENALPLCARMLGCFCGTCALHLTEPDEYDDPLDS